jgi:hypothetical protein
MMVNSNYECSCGWKSDIGEGIEPVWHINDILEKLEDSYQANFWVPHCPVCGQRVGEEEE